MRLASAILLSSLFPIGAGCFQSPEPTVLPEQPERESVTLPGEVNVNALTIEKEFVLNEFAECKAKISYPDLLAISLPQNVSAESDLAVTAFLNETLGSTADVDSLMTLDQLAQGYIDTCQMEIETEYANMSAAGDELFTNLKRSIEVIYSVKLNQFHLLSIGLDEYSYLGGAHPNQRITYVNIDRGGDRLLTLQDIIDPEHLKVFLQYEKTKLLEQSQDGLYPEFIDEYQALIANTSPATSDEQIAAYGDFENFYLTPTSIVTYYNAYEIAPYTAGTIFVEIPYADVKAFVNMNGPLVPLVENLP